MKDTFLKRRSCNGQLSIFAAVIFQALFVLFAMCLNIALVVHDKINLQNSIDIATYYGAMKQAQLLNAVAHINYQIRQSWKLMVWRNRVLGTIGTSMPIRGGRIPQPIDQEFLPNSYVPPNPHGIYSSCIGHDQWGVFKGNRNLLLIPGAGDNFCKNINRNISRLYVPSFGGHALGSFASLLGNIVSDTNAANTRITHYCDMYGYNSWILGFFPVAYFRLDQNARKLLIYRLANDMIRMGKDLDGENIVQGVEKTFKKNLNYINSESLKHTKSQFTTFNSLQNSEPDSWLKDQPLPTVPFYSQLEGRGGCSKSIQYITIPPRSVCPAGVCPDSISELIDAVLFQDSNNQLCKNLFYCNASAGLIKDRDFVVFFSSKVQLKYEKQIFLPWGGDITLNAESYAKPFGGRIGPPNATDPLLPLWPATARAPLTQENYEKKYTPNYSRYPGDPHGLRSHLVHYTWSTFFTAVDKSTKQTSYYIFDNPDTPDILAKDGLDLNIPARLWELAAISPDLFDITYFTILPDFMETYFPKINRFFSGQDFVRGDLGYSPLTNTNQFIKYQVEAVWQDIFTHTGINLEKPFYKVQRLEHILTGWNPPKKKYEQNDNYQANDNKIDFGKCQHWSSTGRKIAIGCVFGGRTGYSVKMISKTFLKQLNNTNVLLNPFPSWF